MANSTAVAPSRHVVSLSYANAYCAPERTALTNSILSNTNRPKSVTPARASKITGIIRANSTAAAPRRRRPNPTTSLFRDAIPSLAAFPMIHLPLAHSTRRTSCMSMDGTPAAAQALPSESRALLPEKPTRRATICKHVDVPSFPPLKFIS